MVEDDLFEENFEEEIEDIKFVWDKNTKLAIFFLIYIIAIFMILVYTGRWYIEQSGINTFMVYIVFAMVITMTYMFLTIIFMPSGDVMKTYTFIYTLTIATIILIAGMVTYPDRMENRQEVLDEYRVVNLSDINAVIEYNVSMYNIHFYEDGNFIIEQYAKENINRQIFEYQTGGDMIFHNDRSIEESYIRITNSETDVYEIVYLALPIQSRW